MKYSLQFSGCSRGAEHKSQSSVTGELPQQLSGRAQLPRYRGRPQVCSSHESSCDPECLSVFYLLHGLHSV